MFKQMLLIETNYVEKENFLLIDFFYLIFVIEAIPELSLQL